MSYHLEKGKTGRARCTVCCEKIAKLDLRVAYGKGKHAHVNCWTVKGGLPIDDTYFAWNASDMNAKDIEKINEYIAHTNSKGSKKRKAAENIAETKVKRIRTEILENEEVWDLNESKLSAPVTLMSVEIINMIFAYLDSISLATATMVCKQWLVLATEDNLWQKLCDDFNMEAKKSDDITWRAHFKACLHICLNCKKGRKIGRAEYKYFVPLGGYLCFKCLCLKKFRMLSKYHIESEFGFKESELLNAGLKFVIRDGCRHFLKSQVVTLHESRILADEVLDENDD
jgi:hypothetical protein